MGNLRHISHLDTVNIKVWSDLVQCPNWVKGCLGWVVSCVRWCIDVVWFDKPIHIRYQLIHGVTEWYVDTLCEKYVAML